MFCCAPSGAAYLRNKSKSLDYEAKSHHRDCGSDPSEKSSFIGGVIAVARDHQNASLNRRRFQSIYCAPVAALASAWSALVSAVTVASTLWLAP
jgi:hypothetical protein